MMDSRNVTQFFKGIAILFVFLCHSTQTFTLPGALNEVFSFLQTGVQLFIVLSSFGLCFSYSKTPVKWVGFMKRRFTKIAVLYWSAIALAALYRFAFAIVMHKDILQEVNPLGILVNALFLHGFAPDSVINNSIVRGGWYIGAIVVLYALFPFLFRLYFSKGKVWEATRKYAFPLIIFVMASSLFSVLQNYEYAYSVKKLLLQLPPFSLGFLLFELQTTNTIHQVKLPFCKGIFFTVLACLLYFTQTVIQHFYVFIIGIAFFYFIIAVLSRQQLLTEINCCKAPVFKFFAAWGEYSFPIYLTHSYFAYDLCFVVTAVLSRLYSNDLLWFALLQPFVLAFSFYFGKCFLFLVDFAVSKIKAAKV